MDYVKLYRLIIWIVFVILGIFIIFNLWKLFVIGLISSIVVLSIIYLYITQNLGEVLEDERLEFIEMKSFRSAVCVFSFFILILYFTSIIFYKNILESPLFHGMLVALGIITILYFVFKLYYSKKL